MGKMVDGFFDGIDSFFAWLSASLRQTTESYCQLETADSSHVLVAHDGSLISIIRIDGVKALVGQEEFGQICEGLAESFQSPMSRPGHILQAFFSYDRQRVRKVISDAFEPARQTTKRLDLDLDDLFNERLDYVASYCAEEKVYFALWTTPKYLSKEQMTRAIKEKARVVKEQKIPPFARTQTIMAAIPDLREAHDAFVRGTINDLSTMNILAEQLEVHDALFAIREVADPDYTDLKWRALLPGDDLTIVEPRKYKGDVSDLLWPNIANQIMPRDAEILDLRTARVGDKIYSTIFIDLFPKDIKPFISLLTRTMPTQVPWRISFMIESDGGSSLKLKATFAAILSFSSAQNRLISDATNLLEYIRINTDDSVVRLRVTASTWAPEGNIPLLRVRSSELAKAIQAWGCHTSEMCGDAYEGVVSSMMGITSESAAIASVAAMSDVIKMLPVTRPASPWKTGALLYRTPDGKPWPFQPGSTEQTTWIDLIYARPGSGKSVLSNAINLALCLSAGIQRLPRIAIIDIGPSSSGLISLLKEALPQDKRHLVAYHRLRMIPEYSINPLDMQLGSRFPTPQERSFLVNFITLLSTPLGVPKPYDGIPDLVGMVVDELFKNFADDSNPSIYTPGIEPLVDGILEEIEFVKDQRTTWWEVTDALFIAGFSHEAMLAQRYAIPLLADAASICRSPTVEDLYGHITVPTGEPLISAFARMISGAVREYPILSRVTSFDLGESKVVSLDLDEVAKSGGDAADRQTEVMYMLARYVLARHYYLTEDNVRDMPKQYHGYHAERVSEIREDPKRIVYDEFHRTSKAQAVRDQVILDMREGRKWKVQVALLSQSLDDFDPIMVEFSTAIYIMDAGPSQTIKKSAKVFGLSDTAQIALRTRVHGPKEGGATFLAQFATKSGINMQLLTLTLGPVELWAFSTTLEDVMLRNSLYKRIGPKEARRVLATLFPSGSVGKAIEERLNRLRDEEGMIEEAVKQSMVERIIEEILIEYAKNPDFKRLPNA